MLSFARAAFAAILLETNAVVIGVGTGMPKHPPPLRSSISVACPLTTSTVNAEVPGASVYSNNQTPRLPFEYAPACAGIVTFGVPVKVQLFFGIWDCS